MLNMNVTEMPLLISARESTTKNLELDQQETREKIQLS